MTFRSIGLWILIISIALFSPTPAWATGTITGTIVGPHGETTATSYIFNPSSGSQVTGTTAADGTFSQVVGDETWSFTAVAPTSVTGYEYATNISFGPIPINDGDTIPFGTVPFHFAVPEGADDDLDDFGSLPPECSESGTPVIIRAYYTDEAKGSFLYTGSDAGITVVTNGTGYTVTVDYSSLEGQNLGTTVETAAHQGNGVYTATLTGNLQNTTPDSGGMAMITVSAGGGDDTRTCLSGPVNLDIRNFLTGSDTTDFTSVSDFRTLSNFTMHRDGEMKLTFAGSVNMLDPTVQRFMKSIGDLLGSGSGRVSLSANAVQELRNAGATITIYNMPSYSSEPTITLNGADPGSAVSGVSYDQGAGTITFQAAHFSEFLVVPTLTLVNPNDSSTKYPSTSVGGTVNDPSATVTLSVNGVDHGALTVESDGRWGKNIPLSMGLNRIVVNGSNSVGNSLPVAHDITRIEADDISLQILSPNQDTSFSAEQILVEGVVSDTRAKVEVFVDDQLKKELAVSDTGAFSGYITIRSTDAQIRIKASSPEGEIAESTQTIRFGSATKSLLPATGIPLSITYVLLLLMSCGMYGLIRTR